TVARAGGSMPPCRCPGWSKSGDAISRLSTAASCSAQTSPHRGPRCSRSVGNGVRPGASTRSSDAPPCAERVPAGASDGSRPCPRFDEKGRRAYNIGYTSVYDGERRGGDVEHLMVISADGHCAAKEPDYREYLDPEYRDVFDDMLAGAAERQLAERVRKHGGNIWGKEGDQNPLERERYEFIERHLGEDDGVQGGSDPDRRVREIEADGIVG